MDLIYKNDLAGGVGRGAASKLDDVLSVMDFGAVGDGIADDTSALQAALDASEGRSLLLPGDRIFLISAPLNLPSGISLKGAGAIRAVHEATLGRWLLQATGKTDISIEGITLESILRVDAGVQMVRWGGVVFDGCERVSVVRTRIRNTVMAGIKLRNVVGGQVIGNILTAAGADFDDDPAGGEQNAEDHSILICAQEEGETRNLVIAGNVINGAGVVRKGITTFASPREQATPLAYFPSRLADVTITANCVWNCTLGGIYAANAPTNSLRQESLTVTGNTCSGNYVNIQISGVRAASITANVARAADGAHGLFVSDAHHSTFAGNQVLRASAHAVRIMDSSFLVLQGNAVLNANDALGGFGCGVLCDNVTDSKISQNFIADDQGRMTFGYYERLGSARNVLSGNDIRDATATNYTLEPTSYRLDTRVVSTTYDPPSIPAGGAVSTTVAVAAAALGDAVRASWSADLQGLVMTSYVSAAGQVLVTFANPTGGPVDLASGVLRLWIATP